MDQLTGNMSEIKDDMSEVKAMQIELLAQFRQMRDENRDALVRVHERIDKHLEGHQKKEA